MYELSTLGPSYTAEIKKYDPDLEIVWNKLEDRYEVWREEWDEARQAVIPQLVARGPAGKTRVDIAQVISRLRAMDTRLAGQSHVEQMDRYLADLAAEEKAKDDEAYEAIRPVHERLAWQVAKETGNLATFVGYTPPPKVG